MPESSFKIDLRFAGLAWELESLGMFREKLEELLVYQQQQEEIRLQRKCAALEDPADKQIEGQLFDALIEETMPRFFRGPYLVALWATLEAGIQELADYIAKIKKLPLALADVHARTQNEKWKKYFDRLAAFPLDLRDETWSKLDELRIVRNVLAHVNGRIDRAKQEDQKRVAKWCSENRGLDIYSDTLSISAVYAQSAHLLVSDVLSSLIERVRAEFPV